MVGVDFAGERVPVVHVSVVNHCLLLLFVHCVYSLCNVCLCCVCYVERERERGGGGGLFLFILLWLDRGS